MNRLSILHLSDTHSQHRRLNRLPDADILIHSGDFTMNGSEQEAIDFMNWFCDLPYSHKIFICGNHDACLYRANIDGLDENVHYLCNSGVVINGVKFSMVFLCSWKIVFLTVRPVTMRPYLPIRMC